MLCDGLDRQRIAAELLGDEVKVQPEAVGRLGQHPRIRLDRIEVEDEGVRRDAARGVEGDGGVDQVPVSLQSHVEEHAGSVPMLVGLSQRGQVDGQEIDLGVRQRGLELLARTRRQHAGTISHTGPIA